jgi:hypothetical protein
VVIVQFYSLGQILFDHSTSSLSSSTLPHPPPFSLTSSANLVQLTVGLNGSLAGHVIIQANGCHGDDAEVQGIQVGPLGLDGHEDDGGQEEDEGQGHDGDEGQVDETDGQRAE